MAVSFTKNENIKTFLKIFWHCPFKVFEAAEETNHVPVQIPAE